jgi:hypothetical protein
VTTREQRRGGGAAGEGGGGRGEGWGQVLGGGWWKQWAANAFSMGRCLAAELQGPVGVRGAAGME